MIDPIAEILYLLRLSMLMVISDSKTENNLIYLEDMLDL